MPHELALGDVYFSPLLMVIILAFFASAITSVLLNKLKISQFVINPSLGFMALLLLYALAIDHYFIQF